MTIPEILAELWKLMPTTVRRGLLTVIGVALVCILVMFAYLAWSTGEIHRRTGLLPTVNDIEGQTVEVVGEVEQVRSEVRQVAVALDVYKDSLNRLRGYFDTTLINPGLSAMVDLQKRMSKLESGQVRTNLAIEESRRQGDRTTEQLIEQMNRQGSAEARAKAEAEQRANEERERDRRLMEAIAKKLKIDTKTF